MAAAPLQAGGGAGQAHRLLEIGQVEVQRWQRPRPAGAWRPAGADTGAIGFRHRAAGVSRRGARRCWPALIGTLASLLFRGFEGGRWSDIPIFKSFVDPRLYLNDPFIQALHEGTPAAYTYRFIAR